MVLKTLYSITYTESDNDRRDGINAKEQKKEIYLKSQRSMSSGSETDSMHIHLSLKQQRIRKSQVDLAIVNFVIALIFLFSYSLVWIWAIYDFVQYLYPETIFKVSK